MFNKLKEILSRRSHNIEPRQGNRIVRDRNASGDPVFSIKGTRFPGFFILFGTGFLVIPTILLGSLLFGSSEDSGTNAGGIFALLFLIPFFLIGMSTFLVGLFLAVGRTDIIIGSSTITLKRFLLGRSFQQKQLGKGQVEVGFEVSHEENDTPRYKLALHSGEQELSLGGSLKEDELLWLEREIKAVLGHAPPKEASSIAERLWEEEEQEIEGTEIDPNFQSKKLRFSKTMHGWEARYKNGWVGCLFLMLFGSIFLVAGLLMEGSLLTYLREHFTFIDDLAKSGKSSGGPPPAWFAAIFGGTGAFVILLGLWLLGFRMTLAKKHSRIHLTKKWFGIGRTRIFETNKIQGIDISTNGAVNDQPRYKVTLSLKTGKKIKLLYFAEPEDAGQLKARLSAELPPA